MPNSLSHMTEVVTTFEMFVDANVILTSCPNGYSQYSDHAKRLGTESGAFSLMSFFFQAIVGYLDHLVRGQS